jgi:hypothetical protein
MSRLSSRRSAISSLSKKWTTGAYSKHRGRLAADCQWQHHERPGTALQRTAGTDARIVLQVVRDHGRAFVDRSAHHTDAFRRGFPQPLANAPEELPVGALPGNRFHARRRFVDHSDPGDRKLPLLHRDPASLPKQLLPVADAHDSRVDAAQHRVHARQPPDLFVLLEVLERECYVARELDQQAHLLMVEEPGFGGVQTKNADRLPRHDDRQHRGRLKAARQAVHATHSERIGCHLVGHDRGTVADRASRHAEALRIAVPGRQPDDAQEIQVDAARGDRHDLLLLLVDDSHPGEPELGNLDGNPADLAQELLSLAHPHDERIDAAQDCVDAVEAPDPVVRPLLLGDVLQRAEPAGAARALVLRLHGLHHVAEVDPFAVPALQPVFNVPAAAARRGFDARLPERLAVVGMQDLQPIPRAAHDVAGVRADELREGFGPALEAAAFYGDHVREPCHELGAAQPRLAVAHRRFRLLAREELADLAADHRGGLEETLVGLARRGAREAEHADRPAFESHRQDEGSALEARTRRGPRRARGPRILARIGHPQRPAALPCRARQPLASPVDDLAGAGDERFGRRVAVAPGVREPQHPGRLVGGEIAAAGPFFRLAYRAYRRLDRRRCALRLGQAARHAMLESAQALGALALGDVLGHADMAQRRVVDPARAERHPDEVAVVAPPARLESFDDALRADELVEAAAIGGSDVNLPCDAGDAGHHLLARFIAQHADKRRVRRQHTPVGGNHEDADHGMFEHRAVERLGLAQGLLGALLRGNHAVKFLGQFRQLDGAARRDRKLEVAFRRRPNKIARAADRAAQPVRENQRQHAREQGKASPCHERFPDLVPHGGRHRLGRHPHDDLPPRGWHGGNAIEAFDAVRVLRAVVPVRP